uniref:F-box only protein 50 isoform X2 n=1 Tax=Geotrypetes seraphini TaxID=260995 RepID=A0A6P8RVW2_GEOSA|nr:F-box only protein 50 isoform X2 [Geotrypetes seraphini]
MSGTQQESTELERQAVKKGVVEEQRSKKEEACKKGEEQIGKKRKGEEQRSKKGEDQVSKKGEEQKSKKGEDQVSKRGEEQRSKKGEDQVSKKGEEQKSKKGEDQVSKKGEEQRSKKGEDQVSKKGEEQKSKKEENQVSKKGEEQIGKKRKEEVCKKGEEQVSKKGEEQVSKKGEEQRSKKGENQVSKKGEEQRSRKGEDQEEPKAVCSIDWKAKCEAEWKLTDKGISTPDSLDWQCVYRKKPFGRNLLKSPNPEGLSTSQPAPQPPEDVPPPMQPLEEIGDFSGWQMTTEHIPVDTSGIPPGVVVCYLPNYSWSIKEQCVDLKAEGLWEELLDSYQPDIYILDWYEDSKLDKHVYELHVKLLAEDQKTVIEEFSHTPENEMSGDSKNWICVSRIFKNYGPGVRYIHFLHKSKDLFVIGFHRTRLTNSTVFVQLRD